MVQRVISCGVLRLKFLMHVSKTFLRTDIPDVILLVVTLCIQCMIVSDHQLYLFRSLGVAWSWAQDFPWLSPNAA